MAATAPAISVTDVDFVSVPASDLAASARFYGGLLGLRRSQTWQRDGEPPLGIEFETGTVTLALIDPAGIGRELVAHSLPIALRVDDVAAARAALEQRGVTFFGETIDSGVCHMSHFADPDGNLLMLHHRYAPPA